MRTGVLAAIVSLSIVGVSMAADARAAIRKHTSIPAQDLGPALQTLAKDRDFQLVYVSEEINDLRTAGAAGELTPDEALTKLLGGTGLTYRYLDERTVTIVPAVDSSGGNVRGAVSASSVMLEARASGKEGGDFLQGIRLAQVEQSPPSQRDGESKDEAGARVQGDLELDVVTVTGTRIRGGATPSAVITITAVNIREEGFSDLGEVIRSVPQNFTGGQNPGVASLGVSGGGLQNQNLNGGSSLNLRGMGPDATLTLLNGRRMAYGGLSQAVDISVIPVEAVERFEIVADGSSAIYGSDAVAGVGNVILKRDFEGIALGARYGAATDGGLATREYTATAGGVWGSGGLIATYRDVSVDPIYARSRDYASHLTHPMTLYPGSDERSWLVSAHQLLGDVAELRLDVLKNQRDQLYNLYAGNNLNVRVTPENEASMISPSIHFSLPNDWTVSVGGTWSESDLAQKQIFEVIGTGAVALTLEQCICHESRIYEVGAEGPLFELPGGNARLAVGAGYRANDYLQQDVIGNFTYSQGEESSRFAYAEMHLPLIGPDSNTAGVRRLEVTAAVRGEDHDGFGGVTTPKFGLIYGPNADFTFKASWGKSFKTPTLHQRNYYLWLTLDPVAFWGGNGYPPEATALAIGGGNPDLRPERATSWTASMAIHPEAIPGLEAELTWFDVDYTDRAIEPLVRFDQVLRDPIYDRFVQHAPTAQDQAELFSRGAQLINRAGVPYDPNDVAALIFNQYVNVTRQLIRGLDLSGSYRFDLAAGRLTLRGSGSWLDSVQETVPGENAFDLAGTLNNPPKFVARIGTVWNQAGFTASAFANYKSGIRNEIENEKTSSFTTVDVALRYSTDGHKGAWSGLEFALSAQNLFDRAPPLHTAWFVYAPPYDTTNYSPVGRFLSASVSKRWRW